MASLNCSILAISYNRTNTVGRTCEYGSEKTCRLVRFYLGEGDHIGTIGLRVIKIDTGGCSMLFWCASHRDATSLMRR